MRGIMSCRCLSLSLSLSLSRELEESCVREAVAAASCQASYRYCSDESVPVRMSTFGFETGQLRYERFQPSRPVTHMPFYLWFTNSL